MSEEWSLKASFRGVDMQIAKVAGEWKIESRCHDGEHRSYWNGDATRITLEQAIEYAYTWHKR